MKIFDKPYVIYFLLFNTTQMQSSSALLRLPEAVWSELLAPDSTLHKFEVGGLPHG